jgi:Uncharacterised nucleotidyltransferase
VKASSRRFLPSAREELLLDIAVGTPEQAGEAWRRLRTQFDIEGLEPGSFAIMPLVYRSLAAADVKDSRLERLKGIYRAAWTRNNVLAARARETIASLPEEPVLLGGLGLAARFYGELALRPTPTIDLLARPKARDETARALERSGWRRTASGSVDWFVDQHDHVCSLRSEVVAGFPSDELWENAESLTEFEGARAVSATDELLTACLTDGRTASPRSIAWIPDAVLIDRAADVDWERVVSLGIAGGETLRLRPRLDYLSSRIAVPPEQRERLQRAHVPAQRRARQALADGKAALRNLRARIA